MALADDGAGERAGEQHALDGDVDDAGPLAQHAGEGAEGERRSPAAACRRAGRRALVVPPAVAHTSMASDEQHQRRRRARAAPAGAGATVAPRTPTDDGERGRARAPSGRPARRGRAASPRPGRLRTKVASPTARQNRAMAATPMTAATTPSVRARRWADPVDDPHRRRRRRTSSSRRGHERRQAPQPVVNCCASAPAGPDPPDGLDEPSGRRRRR